MGWHNGLQIQLSRADRKQVGELLSGGVQPVRTVIRALVLRQMDRGSSTVQADIATRAAGDPHHRNNHAAYRTKDSAD